MIDPDVLDKGVEALKIIIIGVGLLVAIIALDIG